MERRRTGSARVARAALEREYGLIRSAITMVSTGDSQGVVLSGLRYGEQLIEPARRMAAEAGVRVVPLWSADDAGADIRVERLPDA